MKTEIANSLAEQYLTQGYLLIPNLISEAECQALKEAGKKVLDENTKPGQSVLTGIAAYDQLFYRFASDERMVGILSQIMPDGIMFMSDKFVYKSKTHTFATPWHQDIAYWPNTRPKLSAWVALDDVRAENGAMKIIPGSQRSFREHLDLSHKGKEFAQVIDLPDDAPDQLVCEMTAGSVLFFSDLLIHASCKNTSGADRYALIGTYHAPAEDEEFDFHFPARHVISQPI